MAPKPYYMLLEVDQEHLAHPTKRGQLICARASKRPATRVLRKRSLDFYVPGMVSCDFCSMAGPLSISARHKDAQDRTRSAVEDLAGICSCRRVVEVTTARVCTRKLSRASIRRQYAWAYTVMNIPKGPNGLRQTGGLEEDQRG